MHYAEYKQTDPALVRAMVETFPFATITANGDEGPIVAQAPLTFRHGRNAADAVEFHLARANQIAASMTPGTPITVVVHGPGAAISPSWFTASFPGDKPDRSRTAPTYNYINLVIRGRVEFMDDDALQAQIGDLVLANEPADGWRLEELAPELWEGWRRHIQGYRLEIEYFDLTVKLSPPDEPADRPGVVDGLSKRALQDDEAIARLVGGYDGSSASLQALFRSFRPN
ncbi:FMN-binding negative transcriptional regulator [Azospirillum sp. SYSU D00513]|uniref:FMN-binding negative transcriptional regulator n=1 Tax=Azospirillum sp. SYSU D00513 TaxID=2812561 RepID=UPI001A95AA82|nr:FMN-binding negative transcriptional regulator [Azospirillum sp. SYSU D00513]